MLIEKTIFYQVGVCSITSIVGKESKLKFDNGGKIKVTKEQAEKINKSWYKILDEVKDGK